MIVARNPIEERIKVLEARLSAIQRVIAELNNIYEEILYELSRIRS